MIQLRGNRTTVLVGTVLILVFAWVGLDYFQGDVESNSEAIADGAPSKEELSGSSSERDGALLTSPKDTLRNPVPNSQVPREASIPQIVRGQILGGGGQVLVGAEVGWARIVLASNESSRRLGDGESLYVAREQASTTTDAVGSFEFEVPALTSESVPGSHEVIWCGVPGYFVAFQGRQESLTETWDLGAWQQHECPGTLVTAVDQDQLALEGIEIVQTGLVGWDSTVGSQDIRSMAAGLYRFKATTDSKGQVQVPFLSGPSEIQAQDRSGDIRLWRGSDPTRVDFVFGGAVSLSGTVSCSQGTNSIVGGEVLIEVVGVDSIPTTLAVQLGESMDWGPVEVGLQSGASILVQAKAPGFYGTRVEVPEPALGATIEVALELHKANDVWAFPCDGNWEPVVDAVVSIEWQDRFGIHVQRARPQASGHVMFTGVPDGRVVMRSIAKDFCEASVAVQLPEREPATHTLPMNPGSVIGGICLEDGEPCPYFEVLAWPSGFPDSVVRSEFRSQEGRFKITGVAQGELIVMATGRNGSISKKKLVASGTESAMNLELTLGETSSVQGQLVSGDDAPLVQARVQFTLNGTTIGQRVWADPSGAFTIPVGTLTPGAEIRASAEGYSSKQVGLSKFEGSSELGQIVLQRTIPLELTILTNPGQSPEGILIACPMCGLPEIVPNAKGVARYPGVDVGAHELEILVANAVMTVLEVDVGSENPARATLDLTGDASVTVRLKDIPEEYNGGLALALTRSHGISGPGITFGARTGGAAEFEFKNLKAGRYRADVCSLDGLSLGFSSFILEEGEEGHASVTIAQERIALKIEDPNGNPISGVHALFHREDGQTIGNYISNEEGLIYAIPIGVDPAFLCLSKAGVGDHWNIPITLPVEPLDEPFVVIMQCAASMNLKLMNREGPIIGQRCKVTGNGYQAEVSNPGETDSEGLVSFSKLSPGLFTLQVHVPGHWPYNRDFNATTTGEVQEVLIPRLAELTVEVRNSQAILVSNQEVQVWTVDYDKDTRYWQEIGAMTVEPSNWKTDVTGRVHIPTFPEGNYLISTETLNGERVEIPFEVRPDRANVALIVLP